MLVFLPLISSFSFQRNHHNIISLSSLPSTTSTRSSSTTGIDTTNINPYPFTRKSRYPSAISQLHSTSDNTADNTVYNTNTKSSLPPTRRKAPTSRVAIQWVVESIEKVLERENSRQGRGKNTMQDDDVLIEALRRMLKGKSMDIYIGYYFTIHWNRIILTSHVRVLYLII